MNMALWPDALLLLVVALVLSVYFVFKGGLFERV